MRDRPLLQMLIMSIRSWSSFTCKIAASCSFLKRSYIARSALHLSGSLKTNVPRASMSLGMRLVTGILIGSTYSLFFGASLSSSSPSAYSGYSGSSGSSPSIGGSSFSSTPASPPASPGGRPSSLFSSSIFSSSLTSSSTTGFTGRGYSTLV